MASSAARAMTRFRKGWDEIGAELEGAVVDAGSYASLARCTQYAHFTPEFIVRAIWSAVERLGWRGGRVLEPGIGTRPVSGVDAGSPARRLPCHRHRARSGHRADRPAACSRRRGSSPAISRGPSCRPHFDLAIGNPPFSDRTVRQRPCLRSLGLRLHDYFIAQSIDRLKPGGLAAFVTSTGTMDKADASAREHIAATADLVGAIRLPEGSFRSEAGTDVVVDILFFRKRQAGEPAGDPCLARPRGGPTVRPTTRARSASTAGSREHPEFVLGTHALDLGPFGETYTCLPHAGMDLDDGAGRRDQSPSGSHLRRRAGSDRPRSWRTAVDDRGDRTPAIRDVREGSYLHRQRTAP